MTWIPIAFVSYLANAATSVIDKFLLKRLIPHPAVFAFFVSLMGGVVVVAAPFVLEDGSGAVLATSFVSGVTFTAALFLFYAALKRSDASRVVPITGSMTPVFVLILANAFLGETLSLVQAGGFVLVLLGTFLLAGEGSGHLKISTAGIAVAAALFFAASHVATKYLYLIHPFASGLVWRGLGGVAAALILFFIPVNRRRIIHEIRDPNVETGKVFFLGQGLAGVAYLLLNYALALGPVSLVNALAGVQYAFLFLMVLGFSRFAPSIVKESLAPRVVTVKSVGIVVMCVGLAALFL